MILYFGQRGTRDARHFDANFGQLGTDGGNRAGETVLGKLAFIMDKTNQVVRAPIQN